MAFSKTRSMPEGTGQNELNIINAGTYLEGSVETKGSLQINGKVKGMVKAADEVRVGRTGEIIGQIYAKNARIAGKIQGDVFIDQKLTLEETSTLAGNLTAGKLIIDEGAFFNGKSEMGNTKASGSNGKKGVFQKVSNAPGMVGESSKK